MRLGVIQSNYLPWRGYFDFINSVDLFVFHDDLQYTKGDWRNRNKIKTPAGLRWLTVPVHYEKTSQLICETKIDHSKKWQQDHFNLFRANYGQTPFFSDAADILQAAFSHRDATISELNIRLIRLICDYLQIKTRMVMSAEFGLEGTKTSRLIQLAKRVDATCYLSGPAAKDYLEEEQFLSEGIRLEYKAYEYPDYPQPWGDFAGNVTVLDLIANCGRNARSFISSSAPNQEATVLNLSTSQNATENSTTKH